MHVENTNMAQGPAFLFPDTSEAEKGIFLVINLGADTNMPVLFELECSQAEPIVLEHQVVLVLDKPMQIFVLS